MLNSNDTAKVLKLASNDLIKRELPEIVNEMSPEAKVDFVNSVRALGEVSNEIEKSVDSRGNLELNLMLIG